MSKKVLIAHVLYWLVLISGLNSIWTGGYFLLFFGMLSVGFGGVLNILLAALLIIFWLGWFQVRFIFMVNRLHTRMLECASVGSLGGLKSFFNHESASDDVPLAIGAVLSGWWALSIVVWRPFFIPDINFLAGLLGLFLLFTSVIPMPNFLVKLISFSKKKVDGKC